MAEDQIQVVIEYVEQGRRAVTDSMKAFEKQMANLSKVNASMAMSTGKMFPQVSQQIAMINSLGTSIDSGAMKLAKLRQEGSMFSQVFSGNTRRNLAEINQELGFSGAKGATSVFSRISRELSNVQVVAGSTTAHLRDLTAPERFRVMGHVFTETMHQSTMRMINWGKNMQWVGRQLMIGLTLPILYFAREVTQSFLTFNRAQTELQKYLYASGLSVRDFASAFRDELLPAFEEISVATGLYRDDVIEVASAWAAAGYTIEKGLVQYTDLTAQLQLLSQGEIDMAGSIELIRSVQATWGYTTKRTTEELQKLNLVGNITTLTMQEIAESLPVVSSSAQTLNIQASELAAVIAGMRERGVSASQAANTLKFSINRLINPTNKAKEAWEGLGKELTGGKSLIDTLFDEQGRGRGVEGLEEIASAVGRLSQAGQAQIAGILFGGYRADRMLKLIDAMNDSTSQYADGMSAATDEARALATWEEQLSIVQDSAAQKFKVMRVELVTLAQKFGEFIFPYVEKFGRAILEVLKKLENAPDIFKNIAVAIGAVLAAIGPATYVFSQLTEAVGMLGRIFAVGPLQLMFGLSSVEDPFGLLALANGAGRANPAIQMLAGVPLKLDDISYAATRTAESLYGTVDAMMEMNMIDRTTGEFLKTQAVRQGAFTQMPALLQETGFSPEDISRVATSQDYAELINIRDARNELAEELSKIDKPEFITSSGRQSMWGEAIEGIAHDTNRKLDDFRESASESIRGVGGTLADQLDEAGRRPQSAAGQMLDNIFSLDPAKGGIDIEDVTHTLDFSPWVEGIDDSVDQALLKSNISLEQKRRMIQEQLINLTDDFTLDAGGQVHGHGGQFAGKIDDVLAGVFGISQTDVDDVINGKKSLVRVAGGKGLSIMGPEDIAIARDLRGGTHRIFSEMATSMTGASEDLSKKVADSFEAATNYASRTVSLDKLDDLGKQAVLEMADGVKDNGFKFVDEIGEIVDDVPYYFSRSVNQRDMDAAAKGFWTRWGTSLKTNFSSFKTFMSSIFTGQTLQALAPPTQGGGVASSFLLSFANPMKFIIPIILGIGVIANFTKIAEGFGKSTELIVSNIKGIAESFAEFINVLFGGGDLEEGEDAFVQLGETLGKVVAAITKDLAFIAESFFSLFTEVAAVGAEAIDTIINFSQALTKIVTLDFSGIISNITAVFNPFNQGAGGNTAEKLIGSVAGWLAIGYAITRVGGFIKLLIGQFTLFKATMAAADTAGVSAMMGIRTGINAVQQAAASKFPILSKLLLNPWIAIPALVITATIIIQSFMNKVSTAAEAAAKDLKEFANAIKEINESIKDLPGGEADFSSFIDLIETRVENTIKMYNDEQNKVVNKTLNGLKAAWGALVSNFWKAVVTGSPISVIPDMVTEIRDSAQDIMTSQNLWGQDMGKWWAEGTQKIQEYNRELELQKEVQDAVAESEFGAGSWRWDLAQDRIDQIEDEKKALEELRKELKPVYDEYMIWQNALDVQFKAFLSQLPKSFNTKDFKALVGSVSDEIEVMQKEMMVYEADGYITKDEQERYNILQRTIAAYQRFLGMIQTTGLGVKTTWADGLRDVNRQLAIAERNVEALTRDDRSAYFAELATQLSQLSSRVQESVLSVFDDRAEARMEAFDDAADEQMDAMEDRHERQLEMFDEDAEAQVDAIDDKIDALDEQDKKEQELQQKQELRQRRAELMREMELSDAMAFRERLKAIHEGRFDDAMLIELQMAENNRQQRKDLKDLADEEKKFEDDRRKERRREALEARKEKLQERLDKQREALQEQMDAEREALQERLDNQREALQDMLDQQRETLQNMFTELNEELPKNEKQWKRHYDAIKGLADEWGVDMDDAQAKFVADWRTDFAGGLNDALEDAWNIAIAGGMQVSDAAHQGQNQKAIERDQADAQLYRVLQGYIQAQIDAAPDGLSPAQLMNWLGRIEEALKGTSRAAQSTAGQYVPTGGNYAPGIIASQHTGGFIGGKPKSDIPAILQEGEYVIQRSAVQNVGTGYLDKLNASKINPALDRPIGEFHSGGFVNLGSNLGNRALADVIPRGMIHDIASTQVTGMGKEIARFVARSTARSIIREISGQLGGGAGGVMPGVAGSVGSAAPVSGSGRAASSIFGAYNGYQVSKAVANYAEQVRANRLATSMAAWRAWGATSWGHSQHEYGNAVDAHWGSWSDYGDKANPNLFPLWNWAAKNARALAARLVIFNGRQFFRSNQASAGIYGPYTSTSNPHRGHVHADFFPQYSGGFPGYPVGHSGGIFTGKGFKKFGNIQFEAPAMLQPGEAVLSRNVTNALNNMGGPGKGEVINITVEVQGDLYGDESSYRRLHSTLERVGSKIARERGGGQNTRVRIG